ncbi:MAG: FHA domain-containing protein [Chloroflexota bacterium]
MTSTFLSDNTVGVILFFLRLGLTLTLIAFFGVALKTIWQDFRKQTETASAISMPVIIFQPEHSAEEQRFSLNEISLGRDPGCDLQITDESVSARHARCYFRKSQWWLEDNHSSNGSKLNGIPVEAPTVITSGDQLSLGSVKLKISFSS